MNIFKVHYPVIATSLLVVVILVAHVVATNNYDWTKNTISDLGAQGYNQKPLMQFGFLAYGLLLAFGILWNGLSWKTAPIFIYALCVAMTGVFCTKPFFNLETYSQTEANLHSLLAQIAGVMFTFGILVQFFFSNDKSQKWQHLLFFILVIGLSATFGLVSNYQGLVQRMLYLVSFIWLVKYFKG